MINHMRTLLLNQNDLTGGIQSGQPGAELVDPVFQPQALPQILRDVRAAILPTGYTPYQQNMVMTYVTNILHAPELLPYTLAPDTRITYADAVTTEEYLNMGVDVHRWRAAACVTDLRYTMTATNRWNAPGAIMNWTVRHITDSPNTVEIQYESKPWTDHYLTFDGQYSNTLPLLDDYVGIKLYEPTGVLTGDCKFDVTVNAPVVPDAVAIMERFTHLDLRQSVARTIFDGYAPYTQRLYELQRIWQYSPEMLLRMGAFVLAFGYQLERLRLGIGMPASRSTLRQVT